MLKLLKLLSSYKRETVLAPTFKLLEAVFELFVPLVIASIIDVGIYSGKGYIIRMSLILVLLSFIGFAERGKDSYELCTPCRSEYPRQLLTQ